MSKFVPSYTKDGFSLLEILISLGVVGLVVVGVVVLSKNYIENTKKIKNMGSEQDARQFVRAEFDCISTVLMEHSTCKVGGYIRGYNKQKAAMMSSASAGINFNGTKVKFLCSNDGTSINITPEIKHKDEATSHKLFEIPLACKICNVDITSDPMRFPPPPYPQDTQGLKSYYNNLATMCNESRIPGTDPIMRRSVTALHMCNFFGFDAFRTSTCVNGPGDSRCNFTSPHNNQLWYWNGGGWSLGGATGNTWMATLTCQGKTN